MNYKHELEVAEDGEILNISANDVEVAMIGMDSAAPGIRMPLMEAYYFVDSRDLRALSKLFKQMAKSLEARGLGG